MPLLENYQNEILNPEMGNRRQYNLIENSNGTFSFIDVSVYDQEGSLFDATDVNTITHQINLNVADILDLKQAIVGGIHFEAVDVLPTEDISTSIIYLVPSSSSKVKNVKDEFIYIYNYSFTDITSVVHIYPNYESFPSEGVDSEYYISSNNNKIYEWDTSNSEYVESSTFTDLLEVTSLPSTGSPTTLYINTTENKVYSCVVTGEWEQIGSTAIDLSNYYTKTEIDNGVLITTSEFDDLP